MEILSPCSYGVLEKVEEEGKVNHENTNGAFSSSASRGFDFDLNEIPSEMEEPQQIPNPCSLTLLVHQDHTENPPNPNPKTSSTSETRALVRKRRSSGESKKAKKLKPENVSVDVSSPNWLDQVMKTMEETKVTHRISKAPLTCQDAKLIFEKELTASDVDTGQSRFLIPFSELKRKDFLTQEESSFIGQERDEKGKMKPGVKVILVNEKGEKWSLLLKIWNMKKNKNSETGSLNYVLNGGWNKVVKGNGLKNKDKISLWSFRFEGVLYFALGTE